MYEICVIHFSLNISHCDENVYRSGYFIIITTMIVITIALPLLLTVLYFRILFVIQL